MCNKFLGEMELGKIRNGTILLCADCWAKAEIAVSIAEMARNQARDDRYDMPDFFKGIFDKKT